MKSWLKTGIKTLVSLGALVYLFSKIDGEETWQILSQTDGWLAPVGVVIYALSQAISAYRWQIFARPLGFTVPWRLFFDYYMMGMYFSLFLPGSMGGDVGRTLYLAQAQEGRSRREALLSILAERGIGLLSIFLVTGTVCLAPLPLPDAIRQTAFGAALVGLLALVAFPWLPLRRLPLGEHLQRYQQRFPLLLQGLGLSLAVHALMVLLQWMVAQGLGMSVPVLYLTAILGLVTLITVLPVSLNGIGVREGATVYLLGLVGVPNHTALCFSLLVFFISVLTSLLGGWIFFRGASTKKDNSLVVEQS